LNKPLVIQGLSKSFDDKKVIDNISLDVDACETFILLGPNGAGKTTTIKLITGLLAPDNGKITIAGYDVNTNPEEAKAKVGLVPDVPFLYDNLSGREFIFFTGKLRRMSVNQIAGRIEDLNKFLDFGLWFDQKCGGYSHGMKQRVMIAQALLHDPKLLLIDEPMVGLDPRAMLKVVGLINQAKQKGSGVLISTHLIPLAETLADRLAIIDAGRLRFIGSRSEFAGEIEKIYLSVTYAQSDI